MNDKMSIDQAIKWLRPETSKVLIRTYELKGGNALIKVDEAIEIVCDYAEKMMEKYGD